MLTSQSQMMIRTVTSDGDDDEVNALAEESQK